MFEPSEAAWPAVAQFALAATALPTRHRRRDTAIYSSEMTGGRLLRLAK